MTKEDRDGMDRMERCSKCWYMNQHCGVYLWCDKFNKLCDEVIVCTPDKRKHRIRKGRVLVYE
jgi:hypothetical protein